MRLSKGLHSLYTSSAAEVTRRAMRNGYLESITRWARQVAPTGGHVWGNGYYPQFACQRLKMGSSHASEASIQVTVAMGQVAQGAQSQARATGERQPSIERPGAPEQRTK
jgi:hypothetical protein